MDGSAGNGGSDVAAAAGAGVPHMYRHIHKFAQIIKHTLYDHMLQRSGKGEIAKL